MTKEEAISNFNHPDYESKGDDRHIRLAWFNHMVCWRMRDSGSKFGEFRSVIDIDGKLFEECDNGRVYMKLPPDFQAKYKIYKVDGILLGED